MSVNHSASSSHFIRRIIEEDNRTNKYDGRVHTRFPPGARLELGLVEEIGP